MAKIQYNGEEKDFTINNGVLMRFESLGGSLSLFKDQPVSQSIKLACASLELQGDPLDHANLLPPATKLAPLMKDALVESGFIEEDEEDSGE